jgi:3,4-dihydroxy 2-butanone 4-phosphate synthase/GTP cyclohydrolase II
MIIRLAEGTLQTRFGAFNQILYYDGQKEIIALVMGDIAHKEKVLCRVHSHCISAHVFNSIQCDCREQMEMAQRLIQEAGNGIIIWLDQEGKNNGHLALLQSRKLKEEGLSQTEAYVKLGYSADARSYIRAAEILRDLTVQSITLMTNNPEKVSQLRNDGLIISGIQPLISNPTNDKTARTLE